MKGDEIFDLMESGSTSEGESQSWVRMFSVIARVPFSPLFFSMKYVMSIEGKKQK